MPIFWLLIVGALILYILIGYRVVLRMLARRSGLSFRPYTPKVTVIIPTHNAEEYIGRKIENVLSADYPPDKINIIVVDDSDDGTAQVARNYPVKLIRFENRVGKVRAINEGLKAAKTDVVVLTDVDTIWHRDALRKIVLPLLANNVGGVTSQVILNPPKRAGYVGGLLAYQRQENEVRAMEGMLDSVSSMDGRLCAFKKSVLQRLDERSQADDLELAIAIRKAGFKTLLCDEAVVIERAPADIWEEIKQKRKRCAFTIQTAMKNVRLLLDPPSLCFAFIFFSRRILPLFTPFLVLTFLLLITDKFVWLLPALLLPFLLLAKLRELLVYFLILNLGMALGWWDFLTKRWAT